MPLFNKNLKLRVLSSFFYVGIILLGCFNANKFLFIGMIVFFLGLCLYETIKMMQFDANSSKLITLGLVSVLVYLFCSKFLYQQTNYRLDASNILTIIAFIIATSTILFYSDEINNDQAKIILTTIYIGIPFSLAFTLPTISAENIISMEVFLVFCLIWASDSFAYFVGRILGKTKLAPKISENKTVEGLVGGIVGVLCMGYIIENHLNLGIKGNWIIISIIVAIAAPLGDLVESKLKRVFQVKDSSNLLPGHGGFLDRLDSFIFCVPFLYLYYIFALKFIV
jgi:phosphatidate cytidylyltransferase